MASRGVHIDDHELRELQFDLSRAPRRVRSPQGLKHAARAIEVEMAIDASGHVGSSFTPKNRHKKPLNLARYVSSELLDPNTAVIGIEARGAGNLGAILAYGAPAHPRIGNSPATPGSAPAYDPGAGPRRAMNRVLNILADHAEDSTLGKGGR